VRAVADRDRCWRRDAGCSSDQARCRCSPAFSITFGEYGERVRRYAGALHGLGVRRGDTVGFMLSNRPEFHLLDTAAMHLGATPFSIYHTGDVGRFDDDGFLRIIDRNKELIINAAGKNMSPANIEQQLKQGSPLIGQAVAIGDSRPYNVALIVLDPDAAAAFAAAHGLADPSIAAMAGEPTVRGEIAAGVQRANSHLSRVEQIKRFTVLDRDWQPAGDELTPTMKLRRRAISAKYAAEIEALYTREPDLRVRVDL